MTNYCDSDQLEKIWFNWVMTATVPVLEPYRHLNVVYSRVCPSQIITHGPQAINNPWLDVKEHVIVTEVPRFVTSVLGVVNLDLNTISVIGPSTQMHEILEQNGFSCELSEKSSWFRLCFELQKMCNGISMKFSRDEETRNEISQESFMLIIDKIKKMKIRFTPGRAPVFNYLTTAIHRCIFNYLRKENRFKKYSSELGDNMISGNLDNSFRSFKTKIGIK